MMLTQANPAEGAGEWLGRARYAGGSGYRAQRPVRGLKETRGGRSRPAVPGGAAGSAADARRELWPCRHRGVGQDLGSGRLPVVGTPEGAAADLAAVAAPAPGDVRRDRTAAARDQRAADRPSLEATQ